MTIRFRPLQWMIRFYIEVFRGLPILVTVFIVYFGFRPPGPPGVAPLTAAAIALVLWGSAQVAEATRGAVQSIPDEQHEASAALGFGWLGRHRFVILPLALRRLLPPLVSLLVNIIQNSTLAQVIGGLEILEAAERQNERVTAIPPIGLGEIHAFEIFAGVALLFFMISFPLTRLAAYLERRLVVYGDPGSAASIARSVAPSSSTPDAAALASTCSGRVAPTIAEATFGSRKTHASASCAIVIPRPSAIGRSRCTAPRTSSRSQRSIVPPISFDAARESARWRRAGLYLPVRTPWASGDHTTCEIPFAAESGNTSRSGFPPEHRVLRLARDELLDPGASVQVEAASICSGVPLAEADVARLSLAHDLGERLHRLLERRVPS